jgi:hypothetical protein
MRLHVGAEQQKIEDLVKFITGEMEDFGMTLPIGMASLLKAFRDFFFGQVGNDIFIHLLKILGMFISTMIHP